MRSPESEWLRRKNDSLAVLIFYLLSQALFDGRVSHDFMCWCSEFFFKYLNLRTPMQRQRSGGDKSQPVLPDVETVFFPSERLHLPPVMRWNMFERFNPLD